MLTRLIFLFLACLIATNAQIDFVSSVGVDPRLTSYANFYLNVLATEVQTYNWVYCNKQHLYSTVYKTSQILHAIKDNIKSTNNLINGADNGVLGKSNVIIGSKNKVIGLNNWVFVSGYVSSALNGYSPIDDGILVISNYKIDLTKITQIATKPSLAISMISTDDYKALLGQNSAASYFFD